MTKIIRRDALCAAGGSLAMLLAGGAPASSGSPSANDQVALVRGRLTADDAQGRRMVGFLETGLHDGIPFCSLIRQDSHNPAVESIFAEPKRYRGRDGVEVTISFYSPPVGEVEFAVLHVASG